MLADGAAQHPPLLLYAPNLKVDSATKAHIQAAFKALVLLSALSARTIAWPKVDCTSRALQRTPKDNTWALEGLSDEHVIAVHRGRRCPSCCTSWGCSVGSAFRLAGACRDARSTQVMQDNSRALSSAVCTWWPSMTHKCQKQGMHFGDMEFMRADGACKQPHVLRALCKQPFPARDLAAVVALLTEVRAAGGARASAGGIANAPNAHRRLQRCRARRACTSHAYRR